MLRQIICLPIKMYRYLISPLITPSCRYHPSCSEYMDGAIRHYGVFKGLWMEQKEFYVVIHGQKAALIQSFLKTRIFNGY